MALNEHGKLGYIDVLHPMCTTLNEQTKMFSCIWTEFSDSFENFYDNCVRNIEMFTNGSFTPQKDYPPNVFRISCTPWLDFTAFHIQVNDSNFLPFFTIGKFTERDGRTLMPLAIQVHHAVCDGYHVGQFVAKLSELITDCDKWLGTNGQRYN
jgi:chloramphenicol O-acetyltransferase type A